MAKINGLQVTRLATKSNSIGELMVASIYDSVEPKPAIPLDNRTEKRIRSWGPDQIGWPNYCLLVIAVLAQLLTVVIAWELWQVRSYPPILPVFDLPQFSFGAWVVLSLAYILLDPRRGFWIHATVILVASVFDQFRMQPQFLAIIFLMLATLSQTGKDACRWFLASVWLWAGIHKILSPHWFAHASHWILSSLELPEETILGIHWAFALSVGLAEIVVGLAAIFKPKFAAILCVAMHCSIFVLLCEIHWNYSVLPWNIATAIVGCWVMWTMQFPFGKLSTVSRRWLNGFFVGLFLVPPVGFYGGLLDHGYASVLYSDFVPRGLITKSNRVEKIRGWKPVNVPFPNERRTIRQYFDLTAEEGDKLHLFDPRPSLRDQYFCFRDGQPIEIDVQQFFSIAEGEVQGIAMDDPRAKFLLESRGKITYQWYNQVPQRTNDSLIAFAYTIEAEQYNVQTLQMLAGLPNLQQLQLANCPVNDDDLKYVAKLKRLTGIGLNNTNVTDEGLRHLESLPKLKLLEIENTKISIDGMERLQAYLGVKRL